VQAVDRPNTTLANAVAGTGQDAARPLGRHFTLLQIAGLLTSVGTRSGQLAVAWWVLGESGNPAVFAGFIALGTAGEVAARGMLGWFGDRYQRLPLLRVCYLVSLSCAGLLTALAVSGAYWPSAIAVSLVVIGICNGVREPLQMSLIRDFLPPDLVAVGVRRRAAVNSSSALLGPAIGGVLITLVGHRGTLVANVIGVAVGLLLLTMVVNRSEPAQPQGSESWWTGTTRGLRALFAVTPERHLALMTLVVNFALYPMFSVLVPTIVHGGFAAEGWLIGLLEGAFAAGLLLGSLGLVARVAGRYGRDRAVMVGFVLVGASMIATGLCAYAGDMARTLLISVGPVSLALGGIGLTMVTINTGTLRSLASPQAFRNRLAAGAFFISGLAIPLGTLSSGAMSKIASEEAAMVVLGLLVLLAAAIGMRSHALVEALRLPDEEMVGAYQRRYPDAFRNHR